MKKGDIILVSFPFTDLSGFKKRPALVLMTTDIDVTVAFITTQLKWSVKNDVELAPSASNRLKKKSLIRLSKLATIDKELVIGRLGVLADSEIREVNQNLIRLLELE